jgi:phytanoyl-CoA hydroxylase
MKLKAKACFSLGRKAAVFYSQHSVYFEDHRLPADAKSKPGRRSIRRRASTACIRWVSRRIERRSRTISRVRCRVPPRHGTDAEEQFELLGKGEDISISERVGNLFDAQVCLQKQLPGSVDAHANQKFFGSLAHRLGKQAGEVIDAVAGILGHRADSHGVYWIDPGILASMSMTQFGSDHIARHLYRNGRVHVPLASPDMVADEQVGLYREQGFLAIENVFSSSEIDGAKAGLSRLIGGEVPEFKDIQFEEGIDLSQMTGDQRESYVRKIAWFVDHEPRLKAIADSPMLVGLVERLLGTPVKMIQDMALVKPPHVGREKPWHQDDAYFALEPLDKIVGTWIALDGATPANGCMHVIPCSHLQGARPHYHDRDCQLADDEIAVERDLVVPLKPGGVLLFSGLLHHGTPPNRSQSRRRAVQFHYASTSCRSTTPEEHGRFFHDAKGMAACTGMQPRNIADRFL